jgi:hypothetical protein
MGIDGSLISAPCPFNAMSNLRRPFFFLSWLYEMPPPAPPRTNTGGKSPRLDFRDLLLESEIVLRGRVPLFSRSISARVGLDLVMSSLHL